MRIAQSVPSTRCRQAQAECLTGISTKIHQNSIFLGSVIPSLLTGVFVAPAPAARDRFRGALRNAWDTDDGGWTFLEQAARPTPNSKEQGRPSVRPAARCSRVARLARYLTRSGSTHRSRLGCAGRCTDDLVCENTTLRFSARCASSWSALYLHFVTRAHAFDFTRTRVTHVHAWLLSNGCNRC